MASAVGKFGALFPLLVPAGAAAVAYAGHKAVHVDWKILLTNFLTGPGRTSRLLLIFFVLLNWKSMPLGWTVRSPSPISQRHSTKLTNNRSASSTRGYTIS